MRLFFVFLSIGMITCVHALEIPKEVFQSDRLDELKVKAGEEQSAVAVVLVCPEG